MARCLKTTPRGTKTILRDLKLTPRDHYRLVKIQNRSPESQIDSQNLKSILGGLESTSRGPKFTHRGPKIDSQRHIIAYTEAKNRPPEDYKSNPTSQKSKLSRLNSPPKLKSTSRSSKLSPTSPTSTTRCLKGQKSTLRGPKFDYQKPKIHSQGSIGDSLTPIIDPQILKIDSDNHHHHTPNTTQYVDVVLCPPQLPSSHHLPFLED